MDKIRGGFAASISQVFWVGALVMAGALVMTFFLKEVPLRRTHDEEPDAVTGAVEASLETGVSPAPTPPRPAFTQKTGKHVLDLRGR
jgi:hypothetical protein